MDINIMEVEANRFAEDLLVPMESLKNDVESGLDVPKLAAKYQVEECVIKNVLKRSSKAGRELMRKDRDGVTHSELCLIAESWLLRGNRCRVAIAEPACWATTEQPDVIGWNASCSYLIEAKVSRSDFLADSRKFFRVNGELGMGNYRYYICKPGIISVDDLPDGWGLLNVRQGGNVKVIRRSEHFPDVNYYAERSLLSACLYIGKDLKIKSVRNGRVSVFGKEGI